MLDSMFAQSQILSDVAGFLIWQTLKVTIVLAAGYCAVVMCRRANAAQHDLILRIALSSAMLLPALSVFVPEWSLTFDDTFARVWQMATVTYDASRAVADSSAEPGPFALWSSWVLVIWIAGAVILGLRFGLGLAAARRIARLAQPVTDARMTGMADTIRRRFNIGRHVRLVISSRVTTPFTWGIFRPSIVLPHNSARWPGRDIEFVLLHEMAHVRRMDALWYILVSLIAVIYWPNPFLWIVKKRLMIESEKTCDDHVICAGRDGMAYAQHLLEVLRTLRPSGAIAPIGVSMARRSHMEGRIMSILSDRQRSTILKRSLVVWVMALTLLLVLPLAGIRLSAAEQGKEEKAKTAEATAEKLPAPDEFIPIDSGPVLTYQQAPEYPKEARKEGVQGVVLIKALIDKEGKVLKAVVDKSSGHEALDDAALKAAYLNQYNPAMQKEKPVAVWVTYKVDFKLDDKKKDSTGG